MSASDGNAIVPMPESDKQLSPSQEEMDSIIEGIGKNEIDVNELLSVIKKYPNFISDICNAIKAIADVNKEVEATRQRAFDPFNALIKTAEGLVEIGKTCDADECRAFIADKLVSLVRECLTLAQEMNRDNNKSRLIEKAIRWGSGALVACVAIVTFIVKFGQKKK